MLMEFLLSVTTSGIATKSFLLGSWLCPSHMFYSNSGRTAKSKNCARVSQCKMIRGIRVPNSNFGVQWVPYIILIGIYAFYQHRYVSFSYISFTLLNAFCKLVSQWPWFMLICYTKSHKLDIVWPESLLFLPRRSSVRVLHMARPPPQSNVPKKVMELAMFLFSLTSFYLLIYFVFLEWCSVMMTFTFNVRPEGFPRLSLLLNGRGFSHNGFNVS